MFDPSPGKRWGGDTPLAPRVLTVLAVQGDIVRVHLQLLEDPGSDARKALSRKADNLTAWLDGVRVSPRFPSKLSKAGVPAPPRRW